MISDFRFQISDCARAKYRNPLGQGGRWSESGPDASGPHSKTFGFPWLRFPIRNLQSAICNRRGGFTMVEIAICIAVVGFALVAIIGVLPTAMRVQQDNRSDTIIDQDGNYFLEAIRHGAQGVEDLPNYVNTGASGNPKGPVRLVYLDEQGNPVTNGFPANDIHDDSGRKLIGLLSIPRTNLNNGFRVEADFNAISGNAVEKDPSMFVGFKYMLVSEVIPFTTFDGASAFGPPNSGDTNALTKMAARLSSTMYEVRLTFRWPLLRNGTVGNSKKVFRTMVSGALMNEPDPKVPNWYWYFYFEPSAFVGNQGP
jgi:type II secretory pathway pseudopilin PulG